MKYLKVIGTLTMMLISGCANKPTPYMVIDSLVYEKGYMSGFYKQGVTEEIITPGKAYKITVKLDGSSSKKRAQNMLLFHAAKLTVANNAEAFFIHRKHSSTWCGFTNNKDKTARIVEKYGPSAHMYISIKQADKPAKSIRRKQRIAADIIEKADDTILIGESEAVMKLNRKNNYAHCFSRI